jgi:hypothetical protein
MSAQREEPHIFWIFTHTTVTDKQTHLLMLVTPATAAPRQAQRTLMMIRAFAQLAQKLSRLAATLSLMLETRKRR